MTAALCSIVWLYLGFFSHSSFMDIWVSSKLFNFTNCVVMNSLVYLFVFLPVYHWVRLLEMWLLGQYLARDLQKRLTNFPPREMSNFAFPPAEQKCVLPKALSKVCVVKLLVFFQPCKWECVSHEVWNYTSLISNVKLSVGHLHLSMNCFLVPCDNIRSLNFSNFKSCSYTKDIYLL